MIVAANIMVDETKLKPGVYFHSKCHEVNGFATGGDDIQLDEEITKKISDSKKVDRLNTNQLMAIEKE